MKVIDLIAQVDQDMPNSIELDRKIAFVNDLEQDIYSNIVEEYKEYPLNAVKDQEGYSMSGYTFEDIYVLKFGDVAYTKMNMAYNEPMSFFLEGGKLCLNPIPTEDAVGVIKVVARSRPTLKTADTADEDDLSLPVQFSKLYNAYLNCQIAMRQRDFAIANNWNAVYNAYLADFTKWYNDNKPRLVRTLKNKAWK